MEISHLKNTCENNHVYTHYIKIQLPSKIRKWVSIGKICLNCNNVLLDKQEYYSILITRDQLREKKVV